MIDIKITGTLPKINTNLKESMTKVRDVLLEEIYGRFDTSGYGTWSETRQGMMSTLRGIKNTVSGTSGDNWAEVSAKNTIHQRGGLMAQTPKMRRFFWAKWYQTLEERWKWMAISRMAMFFPERKYMALRPGTIQKMRSVLLEGIFSVKESIVPIK
jgi:phage gpG-like protein